MLLKILLIAIVCYYVLKVAVNLWRATQGEGLPGGRMQEPRRRPRQPPRRQERATRYRQEEDIEDAEWEDLSE